MHESFFKDVLEMMSSNILSLIASIITGLIVPMILGATNYGYYRIFILYSTYTALLHFGFVDGVLLKLGGVTYNKLNKPRYRSTTLAFILLELIISFIIIIMAFFINNGIYSFIAIAVGINTFFTNISTYYQFLSQATLNFSGCSIRSAVQSILNILLTILLWVIYKENLINKINYKYYIYIALFISIVMLLMCLYSYKDITFGKRASLYLGFRTVLKFCKIGIYLTIAYQISNLLMIIDNQIVSMFFKVSTYGKYSFAYSMTNTAITVLGAIATVLLPHLKQDTFHHMISIYHKMISLMMLIVYLGLLAYFPLCILIKIILPSYVQSLSYLRIFLPELGITCSVTMITFNYYNVLGKSKFYFYMSLIILFISAIIDLIMYILFLNPILVAFGSFIAIFIWYISSEYFLVKWYNVKWEKNFIYMSLMIFFFFLSSIIFNDILGACVYLILYLITSISLFKRIIIYNIKIMWSKL